MINTEIYGTAEEWGVANLGTEQIHANRNDYFLVAHFGGGGNNLGTGYGYGININQPIDKSLSYCGLGSLSTWSKVEYYKRDRDLTLIASDDRTITNFSFAQAVKLQTMTGIWYAENSEWSSVPYGSLTRFSPQAVNTNERANYNNGFIPITQIPMKNCVLVPVFRVAQQINTDGTTTNMDVSTVNCWDYYGTTATKNHTTHPYILGIGFTFYTKTTDNANMRTGVASNTAALLDKLALYKGQPVNLNEPTQNILDGGFSYCWNVPQSTFAYKTIFGYINNGASAVSNAIDYYSNELPSPIRSSLLRAIAIFPHENAVFSNEWTVNATTYARYYYLQYYDGLQEWVRHQLACFGLFFTDDEDTAKTGEYDGENMFLGILEDGVGLGEYTHGEDNRNQPQWQWDTTNDSDYDPSNPPEIDDNIYGRPWGFNPVSLADSTVRRYVMDDNALQAFGNSLWDIIDTTDPDELIQNQTLTNFLTNNPLDCVISLKRFPFADMSTASAVNIVLGKVRVSAAGKPFAADSTIKSCGIKHVYRRFKDWRDYICEYFLYLPFCGTLQLDAETVIGRDLKVYYAIDYTTGTCTAFITTFDDDGAECYLDSASGNLAIDVALTGVETATLTGQIYNANENLKLTKFNQAIGYVKSGMDVAGSASKVKYNPTGLFNSALDLGQDIANNVVSNKNAEWNINNTQIPLKMIGASSGCNSFQGELRPCLIVHYPITVNGFNKDAYLHTVGAACCESGLIGSYSGYAEVSNVDLSGFRATATEKNMILSALSAGVYL